MSIVACVGAPGVGCVVAGAAIAQFNAQVALSEGAPFGQTIANLAIGFGTSLVASGAVSLLAGPTANPIWGIVAGSASAGIATAAADLISGKSLGSEVLWSVVMAAGQGALTYGVKRVVALTREGPVNLNLNLKFVDPSGNPIPAAEAEELTAEAEKAWSGRTGKFYVTANFHDPTARTVTATVYPGGGRAFTEFLGGSKISLFEAGFQRPGGPLVPYEPGDLGDLLAHEIGHVFGAVDQYDESTHASLPGHEHDIMGVTQSGNKPLESTITEILLIGGGH